MLALFQQSIKRPCSKHFIDSDEMSDVAKTLAHALPSDTKTPAWDKAASTQGPASALNV